MARPKYAASLQPRRVVPLVVFLDSRVVRRAIARRLAHRRRTSVSASHTCPHRAARPRTATLAHEQCSVSAEPRALRGSGRSPCSDDARSRWWYIHHRMTRRSLVRLDPGISEERPCHARIVRRLHVASHRMVCARDGSGCVGRRQGRLYMYEAHAPPTAEGAAGASFLQYGVWYEC